MPTPRMGQVLTEHYYGIERPEYGRWVYSIAAQRWERLDVAQPPEDLTPPQREPEMPTNSTSRVFTVTREMLASNALDAWAPFRVDSPSINRAVRTRRRRSSTPHALDRDRSQDNVPVTELEVQNIVGSNNNWMSEPGVKLITDVEARACSEDHFFNHPAYLVETTCLAVVTHRSKRGKNVKGRTYRRVYSVNWSDVSDFMDLLSSREIAWYMVPNRIVIDMQYTGNFNWVYLRAPRD